MCVWWVGGDGLLWCDVWCAVLWCVVVRCAILHSTTLYSIIHNTTHTIHYTTLHYNIHYTTLHYNIHYTILACVVQGGPLPRTARQAHRQADRQAAAARVGCIQLRRQRLHILWA
jgi:hypothetical protein